MKNTQLNTEISQYMVYVEGTEIPKVFHDTFESAYTEAQRLITMTKKNVVILKTIAGIRISYNDFIIN